MDVMLSEAAGLFARRRLRMRCHLPDGPHSRVVDVTYFGQGQDLSGMRKPASTYCLAVIEEDTPRSTRHRIVTAHLQALLAQFGAVVVKRRAEEEESKRYGYRDEHRRHEPDQLYPSCLTQAEWELVADLASSKRGSAGDQYSRWDLVCVLLRGAQRLFLAARVSAPTFRRWAAGGKFQMHDRFCGGAARSARRSRLRRSWMRNRPAVPRRAVRAAMMPERR